MVITIGISLLGNFFFITFKRELMDFSLIFSMRVNARFEMETIRNDVLGEI